MPLDTGDHRVSLHVRARRDLVEHRVAAAHQLRAHLQVVFPAVMGLFSDLDSQVSLAFLERFTKQNRADRLTPTRLAAWLSKVGYSGRVAPKVLHQRLFDAPRGTTNTDAEAQAAVTLAFVAVLRALNTRDRGTGREDRRAARGPARRAHRQVVAARRTLRAARLLVRTPPQREPAPSLSVVAHDKQLLV